MTHTQNASARGTADEIVIRIDGRNSLSTDAVAAVNSLCDRAEDSANDARDARAVLHLSGIPDTAPGPDVTVAMLNKWERALRRLERLPVVTIAVVQGDCGGIALDALLATDYRISTRSTRLMMPVVNGATWPGMVLYRLAHQGTTSAAVRRAVLFGAPITASEALALHLVHELTDDVADALEDVTTLTALLTGTELAIRRQLLFDAPTASFEDALGAHLAACDRALRLASAGTRQ